MTRRPFSAAATASEPEPQKGMTTSSPGRECTSTSLSQILSGFIDGCSPYCRSLEREFSRGISHQLRGGRPRLSASAVTLPTPLARASAASLSVYGSAAASALKVCEAPGLTNHSRCSIRTE